MIEARAAIYVRVSKNRTDDRAKPDRQIKACELLAEAKSLTLVAEPFVDDDVSAYKGTTKRPQYEALLELIRSGEVDVVLSWHIDRMLRTTKEMLTFIELAEATGVRLESVQGGSLDLNTPAGRMVATILAAVAQSESELKAERHLLKNQQTRATGGSTGGPVPFGWVLGERVNAGNSRSFVVDEPAQAVIREATLGVISGMVNLSQIARRWNELGFITTFKKPWNHNSVKKILVRPRNAGLVDHRGAVLEGVTAAWEPLVSEEQWRTARNLLLGQTRPKASRKHLMSNLLVCEKCSEPLVAGIAARRHKGVRYVYDVYKHPPTVKNGCGMSIRREMVEVKVRTHLRHLLTFAKIEDLAPVTRDLNRAIALRQTVGDLEARMRELEELWSSGDFSTTNYKSQRKNLGETRTQALEGLAEIERGNAFAGLLGGLQSADFMESVEMGKRFDALTLDHRKTVIKTVFPRIEIVPGRGEDRVHIYNTTGERVEFEEDEPYDVA